MKLFHTIPWTIAPLILLTYAAAVAQSFGTWETKVEIDLTTNTRQTLIYTPATDHKTNGNSEITVRCAQTVNEEPSILIQFEEQLGPSDTDYVGAWRFWEGEPQAQGRLISVTFQPSNDGTAGVVPEDLLGSWIRKMQIGGTLSIRVNNLGSTPRDYQFDLTGFNDAWLTLGCHDVREKDVTIESYMAHVYVAVHAYFAEVPNAGPEDIMVDCSTGYTTKGGEYRVRPLTDADIATCTVELVPQGDHFDAEIHLQQTDGTQWSFP